MLYSYATIITMKTKTEIDMHSYVCMHVTVHVRKYACVHVYFCICAC